MCQQKKVSEKDTEADNLKKENEELKKDNALKLEINRSNAEAYFKLRAEKEKEIAGLQAKEENFREKIATSQALNQFFMMANFLSEHQDRLSEVLKGYVNSDPLTSQRITQIKKIISNFDKILSKISN